jgi:cupin 2 domain-containing protein
MVNLTAADMHDAPLAEPIVKAILRRWLWLKHLFADDAYDCGELTSAAAYHNFAIEGFRPKRAQQLEARLAVAMARGIQVWHPGKLPIVGGQPMPPYPPDPGVQAEARRLVAENLDRDLDQVAELLAKMGHHGPDGAPYPTQTVQNLLDDDLRRAREDHLHKRIRPAAVSPNQRIPEHGTRCAVMCDSTSDGGISRTGVDDGSTEPAVFGRLAVGGPRPALGDETFLDLLTAPEGVRIERIVSYGAASLPDFWYEQAWDEFVLVVSGSAVLAFPEGREKRLQSGDYAILPAFCRHRVASTDLARETIWLAVHMPPKSRSAA